MADEYDRLPFEDAIDIVVLRAAGGHTVPVAGSTPIDLDNGAEPVGELLTDLLAATVRVRVDEGTPPDVLAALRRIPVPAAFRTSPWLDASRAIVVRDGAGRAGQLTVRYSVDSGLRFDQPEADSEADPDADFGSNSDDDENG
ncbi:hypothetical protein ABT297_12730 [Dactylosporangium sp. NPDC000555]|uniref:hypothetical protein n=1 Tax=Dactylosporangium sp. NPDC000555 TaxID=3154260 RepID=UPI0033187655